MKKIIYKINNKNLVTGNPNEVIENEILVKENNDGTVELSHRNNGTLETLGSSGNGGGNEPIYLKQFNIEDLGNIYEVKELVKPTTLDGFPLTMTFDISEFLANKNFYYYDTILVKNFDYSDLGADVNLSVFLFITSENLNENTFKIDGFAQYTIMDVLISKNIITFTMGGTNVNDKNTAITMCKVII